MGLNRLFGFVWVEFPATCCQEDFFHASFLDAGPDEEKTDVISPKPAAACVVGMEAFVRKVLDAVPLKHVPDLLELFKGSLQKKVKTGTLCSGSDCVVDILKAIWLQMWTLAKCLPWN